MPPSPSQQVRVRVPATTANLGCGFDIMGLALQLYNVFTFTLTPEPVWRVSPPPGMYAPTHSDNLVFRAARRLFHRVGFVPKGLHLQPKLDIPLARGLGSSSTAIVAGLMAANALTGNTLSQRALLTMAIDIEGHPDNVTPAILGGLTLSYKHNGRHAYQSIPFPDELTVVVAIPDFKLPTAQARAVLPAKVSRADAIFNCSRTALLVSALYTRRYDLLTAAMDDRLHQPYRAALVPGMIEAIKAGYAAKALGVALSGAGPSLVAIVDTHPAAVAAAMRAAFARHRVTCKTLQLHVDTKGATVG